ncbi:MAG TPA: hypothetical protein VHU83_10540 [Bryobacteraceae bacterium]|jgi:hypothetical protein|nr:hypothetical protein [Bryobacteraceae bacterium]
MKLFNTLGAIGLLAFTAASPAATIADSMRVHVPFAFVVAGQQFAAGDYTVCQSDSGIVTVQGAGKAAMTLSYPAQAVRRDAPGLRFTGSEQRYLVGIQGEALARSIPVHTYRQRKLALSRQ